MTNKLFLKIVRFFDTLYLEIQFCRPFPLKCQPRVSQNEYSNFFLQTNLPQTRISSKVTRKWYEKEKVYPAVRGLLLSTFLFPSFSGRRKTLVCYPMTAMSAIVFPIRVCSVWSIDRSIDWLIQHTRSKIIMTQWTTKNTTLKEKSPHTDATRREKSSPTDRQRSESWIQMQMSLKNTSPADNPLFYFATLFHSFLSTSCSSLSCWPAGLTSQARLVFKTVLTKNCREKLSFGGCEWKKREKDRLQSKGGWRQKMTSTRQADRQARGANELNTSRQIN